MATKKNAPAAKKSAEKTTVTKIKATDTKPQDSTPKKTAPVGVQTNGLGRLATPFNATGAYFKGAWYELRQVRWPNRRATWGLTAAVIGFTAAFAVLILLLDALFKYLFQLILG